MGWKRKVGIELEFNITYTNGLAKALKEASKVTGQPLINHFVRSRRLSLDSWVLKPEASAQTEINTPASKNTTKIRKGLRTFLSKAKTLADGQFRKQRKHSRRGLSTDTGMHVHVDVSDLCGSSRNWDLPMKHLLSLVYLFSFAERHFRALVPKHRRNCSWARTVDSTKRELDRECDIPHWWQHLRSGGMLWETFHALCEDDFSELSGKCMALNISEDYPTVEFRGGASTYEVDDVINWATICQAFVDECVKKIKEKDFETPDFGSFEKFLGFCRVSPSVKEWARKRKRTLAALPNWRGGRGRRTRVRRRRRAS